jgi:hypothetical protein
MGCNQLPKQIPKDFQLLIEATAIQPGVNGNYSLMIRQTAREGQFEFIRNYDNITNKLILNSFTVQRLYDEVRHAKIFRLKSKYEDMNILDGSNTTLTIKANGKMKIISMRNTYPRELKGVFLILNECEAQLNNDH